MTSVFLVIHTEIFNEKDRLGNKSYSFLSGPLKDFDVLLQFLLFSGPPSMPLPTDSAALALIDDFFQLYSKHLSFLKGLDNANQCTLFNL
jgi:hypothetical protein